MKKLLVVIFIFAASLISAQDVDAESDSAAADNFGWAAYPIVFYTPETQLGYGLGGMIFFRDGPEANLRPSKIKLSTWLSSNMQYSISLFPLFYFSGKSRYVLDSKFIYAKEIWKYYGIGNNSPEIEHPEYEQKTFRIYLELVTHKLFFGGLESGPLFDFNITDITDRRENELLYDQNLTGWDGGINSGLGWSIMYDRRNNIFFPTSGGYHKLRFTLNDNIFGSDFHYSRLVLDFRHFIDLIDENVLALQFYYEDTDGEVPFYKLPQLGGEMRMRGYFMGRYRDKKYMMFQAEYRKILWWRIGVAAFFAYGDVSSSLKQFHLPSYKPAYGFGLRLVFDEKERMNLRIDLGFGPGTDGLYFSLDEAF